MIKERRDSKGNVLKLGEYEKKNGLYEYRYKNQDEQWCSVYADKLSQLRALKYSIYMKESIHIRENMRNVTLNDQFDMWIETKVHLRENTRDDYKYMYDAYVRNGLGRQYINEITTNHIKQHYNSLIVNRRIKVETVAHIQNIVFQVFQSAKDSGQLIQNPAERAIREYKRIRSKHTSPRQPLTVEQELVLVTFLRESEMYRHWYPIFYVMLKTGMRLSEVVGLRWCDIDMEKKIISVNHTLVQYSRSKVAAGYRVHDPKTIAGKRSIPFEEGVKFALLQEKEYQREQKIVCNMTLDGYTDFIFLNAVGNVHGQATLNRAMARIVGAYNANPMQVHGMNIYLPHITCHVLRHSYATRLCECGVHPKVAQTLLGHDDIQSTMSIYTKASQELLMKEYTEKVTKKRN